MTEEKHKKAAPEKSKKVARTTLTNNNVVFIGKKH